MDGYSQERENIGSDSEPKWVNKYTIRDLLDPDFQIQPDTSDEWESALPLTDGIVYDEIM